MPKNLFVTALFDLYPKAMNVGADEKRWTSAHLSVDFRIQKLSLLINSGVDLVVFVQERLIDSIGSIPKNVAVIPCELSDFPTYKFLENADQKPRLPANRNPIKDTYEYLSLMNSKFDFVQQAAATIPGRDHYSWIDAAIFKMCPDPFEARQRLLGMSSISSDRIVAPCGRTRLKTDAIWPDRPCWRFLGGLFIIPSDLLDTFKKGFDAKLRHVVDTTGVLTWEVNILAYLEVDRPEWFIGYQASHDRSILHLPDVFKGDRDEQR